MARQRALANDVSHELRTPIARLSFELDLLDAEASPAARAQLVQDMRDDLRGLDALVGELLLEARLEHAGTALPRDARQAGITCQLAAADDGAVPLHPHYMGRALLNLVRNALAHARSQVQVQLRREGNHWQLQVSDDGDGIAVADRERVFEPFTRLDQSRQRATGGVGLGLSMVARIAACHGGHAAVQDSALGGAAFVICWPDTR
ncbi:MAG: Sensor protein RstB [Stenotrophomonas maltophilia]|uniref:histidine kinase n=1 Tax=Stenotrophomonas maltophilia TaxID=40324 RepID=A0A7V8FIL5_STEMA|nr:MAG: Sensor protein RstB [Stenotrophomonas maltophilia]